MTTSCRERLQKKIRTNMHEYANPKQAIAISYSQVLKASPHCKPQLRRKSPVKKSKSPRTKPLKKSVKKSIKKPVKKSLKKSIRKRY